jgi:hexosaminidase
VTLFGAVTGTAGAAAPSTLAGQRPAHALGDVVPAPAAVRPDAHQVFAVTRRTAITVPARSPEAAAIGRYLAGILRPSTGYRLPVRTPRHGRAEGIVLRWTGQLRGEAYRLDVTGRAVTIAAATPAGLFAGVQTLRQLLPAQVEARSAQRGPWLVPGGHISDQPRFSYRGAMLDVARHFFTVAQVKRYIDQVAQYKVNYLHLHLADDQGWRIEIRSWPRLATYGGSTAVDGDPGGYYTQRDYTEIVRYARSRYITVVPEIDMPGHTNAALASYAELNCDGVAPPLYTGTDVGFSSLCVGKPVTYRFLRDVIRELAALTPGPYLHIGGDEAQATPPADYLGFLRRVLPMVTAAGKRADGWHDYLAAGPPRTSVGQYWGFGPSDATVTAAVQRGNRIVMSPANKAYLDMKYNPDTPLGQDWAGLIEVSDAYGWDPGSYLAGVPERAVLGVEAPLWTETIRTSADIEFMAFPRLPAIAELGWSPAAAHGQADFLRRLAAQGPRWDRQGINYYRSPQVRWP